VSPWKMRKASKASTDDSSILRQRVISAACHACSYAPGRLNIFGVGRDEHLRFWNRGVRSYFSVRFLGSACSIRGAAKRVVLSYFKMLQIHCRLDE